MAWTHIQGSGTFVNTPIATLSIVMGAAPTVGNLVCFGIIITCSAGLSSNLLVQDSNGNTYTISPNSPSAQVTQTGGAGGGGQTGQTYAAYLVAPANASATITATWTNGATTGVQIFVDEFHSTLPGITFDADAADANATGAINQTAPVITPNHGAGELFWSISGSTNTYTAPTAGATLGVWTGGPGGVQDGDLAEYDLSGPAGATGVAYTQPAVYGWSGMVMAFYNSGFSGAGTWWMMPPMMQG
jgi:hypothetical protein